MKRTHLDRAPFVARLLSRARRRQRWIFAIEGLCWGAMGGVATAAALTIFYRFSWPPWPLYPTVFWPIIGGAALGSLVLPLWKRRRGGTSALAVALALEAGCDLQQRLSSLVVSSTAPAPPLPDDLAEALARDGDLHSQDVQLDRALPLTRPRGSGALAGAAVLWLVAVFMPQWDASGREAERRRDAAERQSVETARQNLRERAKKLEMLAQRAGMSAETKQLLARMQELEQQARPKNSESSSESNDGAGERRRALAEIDRLKDAARELSERPELRSLDSLLEQLKSHGQRLESTAAQALDAALKQGDLAQAANQLRELSRQLSEERAKSGANSATAQMLERDLDLLRKKLSNAPGVESALSAALAQLEASGGEGADFGKNVELAAGELEALARLLREKDVLDSAQQDIEFTAEELASLAREAADQPDDLEPCELCKQGGT